VPRAAAASSSAARMAGSNEASYSAGNGPGGSGAKGDVERALHGGAEAESH
jgi:hypothetical protein